MWRKCFKTLFFKAVQELFNVNSTWYHFGYRTFINDFCWKQIITSYRIAFLLYNVEIELILNCMLQDKAVFDELERVAGEQRLLTPGEDSVANVSDIHKTLSRAQVLTDKMSSVDYAEDMEHTRRQTSQNASSL